MGVIKVDCKRQIWKVAETVAKFPALCHFPTLFEISIRSRNFRSRFWVSIRARAGRWPESFETFFSRCLFYVLSNVSFHPCPPFFKVRTLGNPFGLQQKRGTAQVWYVSLKCHYLAFNALNQLPRWTIVRDKCSKRVKRFLYLAILQKKA